MRILLMSDSPNIHTGMGIVGKNIALGLHKRGYEVNYLGWFADNSVVNAMPFPLFSTKNQYYGRDAFDGVVLQTLPDIVLTIGDKWMVDYIADWGLTKSRRLFKWVGYVPIDGHGYNEGLPTSWVTPLRDMDYIVAYTEYGRGVIKRSLPDRHPYMIHHGVDTSVFHPVTPEARVNARKQLGVDNNFIFLVNARNQFRKNLPEIFKAWKIFKKMEGTENAKIWLHCWFQDPMGWNLDELIDMYDMQKEVLYFEEIAHGSSNVKMLEEKNLNMLYNISDVFLLQIFLSFSLYYLLYKLLLSTLF